MSEPLLAGIDIGTSACKTALFSVDGRAVAESTAEYPVNHPEPGWAEQDPDLWFSSVCRSIRECIEKSGRSARDIACVGIDGQSWSAIAVDEKGCVLTPDPIWMDNRSADICRRLNAEIGEENLLALSSNPLTANYTTGKIIWYKENLPEVFGKTYRILQSEGFIAYRLTGKMTMCRSEGYGLHCYDMKNGCWDSAMAHALGIPTGFLPELYDGSDVIGRVSADASRLCGLCEGTPVVAGALDAAAATLGAGIIVPGDTQEQGGTSGGMSICTDRPTHDRRLILCAHAIPGMYLLQGGTTGGGGALKWALEQFGDYERYVRGKTGERELAQFDRMAASAPAGCDGLIFLPYMSGERTPIWKPDAKGVFYGVDYRKTKAHFIRAIMEGVCYSLLHNLDTARQIGADITALRATGGSANSLFWTQMKADVTGLPVSVPDTANTTGLGAAILAGIGCGIYRDFSDAKEKTCRTVRTHCPESAFSAAYSENYKKYLELSALTT